MPIGDDIRKSTGLDVYASSVVAAGKATYFVARRGGEKVVGCVGAPCLSGASEVGRLGGDCVCAGPLDRANAAEIRRRLPWTAPRPLGLSASVGMGDRLGLATPGHIRAVRGSGLMPVLAQQSIREMTRTGRTAQDVIDCATWGVLQEGWREGFGADADHIQQPEGLDLTADAGCTLFTIDPGQHVNAGAEGLGAGELAAAYDRLDLAALETTGADLKRLYAGRTFSLGGGGEIAMDEPTLARAAVKYCAAVAHIVRMHRHLRARLSRPFEVEVSVDETAVPTTPAEHYFIASELKRLGVAWVSLAPRFVGSFEKGVDYVGDLGEFRRQLTQHVAVMRTLGPYKISIHSGSDKFSIYPIVAELCGRLVHLKTAGTSWLEALRAVAIAEPSLFREIVEFARERYATDRQSYHVSADATKVPSGLSDERLPALLDDFHAREVLHVTFGSVLRADDGERFGRRLYAALEANEEVYYDAIRKHLGRHVAPLARIH